jgi:hypothetical protein
MEGIMEQEFVKVGPSPDFTMTRGQIAFFHSVAFTVTDVSGRTVDSRRITNRSFKAVTDELKSTFENRFCGEKYTLETTQQHMGVFNAVGSEGSILIKYRIIAGLDPKQARSLITILTKKFNSFSNFPKHLP